MFYVTQLFVATVALTSSLLNALGARPAAALATGCKVGLWFGAIQPSPNDVLATYTAAECTFGGYAKATMPAYIGPITSGAGYYGVHGEVDFAADNTITTSGVANGYFVTDGAGAVLMGAERFPSPVNFIIAGNFLSIDVNLALPTSWRWQ